MYHCCAIPSNTRRWSDVAVMLGRRLRRWPNITATLDQRLAFGGMMYLIKDAIESAKGKTANYVCRPAGPIGQLDQNRLVIIFYNVRVCRGSPHQSSVKRWNIIPSRGPGDDAGTRLSADRGQQFFTAAAATTGPHLAIRFFLSLPHIQTIPLTGLFWIVGPTPRSSQTLTVTYPLTRDPLDNRWLNHCRTVLSKLCTNFGTASWTVDQH